MKVKEIGLSWIVVKDLKAAVKYYTEVVGLKLLESSEEYGWAELGGYERGSRLGIAMANPREKVAPGQNAVVTFTVADVEKAKAEMVAKGAKPEGDIQEVPGHVKMQTLIDQDGNRFQICQHLHHS
ncbi:MAG: VOC family protein [Verrucomicrobiota bacterium]|nr:VOC family protein [Verrucomicrobiota bacterium]